VRGRAERGKQRGKDGGGIDKPKCTKMRHVSQVEFTGELLLYHIRNGFSHYVIIIMIRSIPRGRK
jgi:hypothetical protein